MPAALHVDSLWKCYAAGVRGCSARAWVLRGLSLTVEVGERVLIAGAAGSGKSTLAACLLGLRAPTAGTIEIGGAAELVELESGRSGCRTVRSACPVSPRSDLQTSILVFASRADAFATWADRRLILRDGRLHDISPQPMRRVAERPVALRPESPALR